MGYRNFQSAINSARSDPKRRDSFITHCKHDKRYYVMFGWPESSIPNGHKILVRVTFVPLVKETNNVKK